MLRLVILSDARYGGGAAVLIDNGGGKDHLGDFHMFPPHTFYFLVWSFTDSSECI